MTRYLISVTDFHERIVEAIRRPSDVVILFPKRGSRREKLRLLPKIAWTFVRATFDRRSHVVASHPFSSVISPFLAVARSASFFDDGTAYYSHPTLPGGRRERWDRRLSARFVDWRTIDCETRGTYPDMLQHANLAEFFAIRPNLIPALPYAVVEVDLDRAFPRSGAHSTADKTLFLDTRDDYVSRFDLDALMHALERLARSSADQTLHFKAHPSQVSRASAALRRKPWAVEISGALEGNPLLSSVATLISFYSSGALSTKAANPEVNIVNLRTQAIQPDSTLQALFDEFGATEEVIPDAPR